MGKILLESYKIYCPTGAHLKDLIGTKKSHVDLLLIPLYSKYRNFEHSEWLAHKAITKATKIVQCSDSCNVFCILFTSHSCAFKPAQMAVNHLSIYNRGLEMI